MTRAEFLCFSAEGEPIQQPKIPNNFKTAYGKQHMNTRNKQIINRHLTDNCEKHMEKYGRTPTAAGFWRTPIYFQCGDDISLGVDRCYHNAVRAMLKKHEPICSDELGEITIIEHRIGLITNARPFESPPYRAGPKRRELEQFEVQKQLHCLIDL